MHTLDDTACATLDCGSRPYQEVSRRFDWVLREDDLHVDLWACLLGESHPQCTSLTRSNVFPLNTSRLQPAMVCGGSSPPNSLCCGLLDAWGTSSHALGDPLGHSDYGVCQPPPRLSHRSGIQNGRKPPAASAERSPRPHGRSNPPAAAPELPQRPPGRTGPPAALAGRSPRPRERPDLPVAAPGLPCRPPVDRGEKKRSTTSTRYFKSSMAGRY